METLDFRSDTVTRPDAAMRRAMAAARVGDDVFGEDPTVRELEERVAGLFGREAALLMPSGTMANLVAVGIHAGRGDEAVLERRTHTFFHEAGGMSSLMGVAAFPVDCPEGWLTADALEAARRPDNVHFPRTRLAIVENTANLAGGRVVPATELARLRAACRTGGTALHLDGARIWNAATTSNLGLGDYGALADTLSCSLCKGLGCPVGALLVGDRAHVEAGRRLRKMLGGGMRQAGILAAAGLHALDVWLPRLAEDHALASRVALTLRFLLDESVQVQEPETNIILLHTGSPEFTRHLLEGWESRGVRALALGPTCIRLVTHHDLPEDAAFQLETRLG
jgi:threonine aldolase